MTDDMALCLAVNQLDPAAILLTYNSITVVSTVIITYCVSTVIINALVNTYLLQPPPRLAPLSFPRPPPLQHLPWRNLRKIP